MGNGRMACGASAISLSVRSVFYNIQTMEFVRVYLVRCYGGIRSSISVGNIGSVFHISDSDFYPGSGIYLNIRKYQLVLRLPDSACAGGSVYLYISGNIRQKMDFGMLSVCCLYGRVLSGEQQRIFAFWSAFFDSAVGRHFKKRVDQPVVFHGCNMGISRRGRPDFKMAASGGI